MTQPHDDAVDRPRKRPAWPPVDGVIGVDETPRAPRPRRSRVLPALATLAALLVIAVGVLTGLYLSGRSEAADVAAAEAVEDEQEAEDVAIGEAIVGDAEDGLADLEAEAASAEVRADEAEAALSEAEESASATDGDVTEFLRLLRVADSAFVVVPDGDLVEFGQVTCDYLDTFGNSDETIAELGSLGIDSGLTAGQTAAVTSAAIVELCPRHALD